MEHSLVANQDYGPSRSLRPSQVQCLEVQDPDFNAGIMTPSNHASREMRAGGVTEIPITRRVTAAPVKITFGPLRGRDLFIFAGRRCRLWRLNFAGLRNNRVCHVRRRHAG